MITGIYFDEETKQFSLAKRKIMKRLDRLDKREEELDDILNTGDRASVIAQHAIKGSKYGKRAGRVLKWGNGILPGKRAKRKVISRAIGAVAGGLSAYKDTTPQEIERQRAIIKARREELNKRLEYMD